MLFHSFESQEERRNYGGSYFIEIQFCDMPFQSEINDFNFQNWRNDSLYVYGDDDNVFYNEYKHYFDCGIYANLKTGIVDLHGINYYSPDLIEPIIEKIVKGMPKDYEIIAEWLNKAKLHNGFYILGL